MLADQNERPDVSERYETATNASRLLLEEHRTGAADVLVAAGWSPTRIGMALLRLHSEWSSAAKPKRPNAGQLAALTESIKAQDELERANRERENAELDRLERLLDSTDDEGQRFDLMVSIMERRRLYESGRLPMRAPAHRGKPEDRAHAEADRWFANELRILALNLKSRAAVWDQLAPWAAGKGIEPEIVAAALLHWLAPECHHCGGLGLLKVPNQPALSARPCRKCNGGKRHPPEGAGRVLGHLDYYVGLARGSLKQRLRGA